MYNSNCVILTNTQIASQAEDINLLNFSSFYEVLNFQINQGVEMNTPLKLLLSQYANGQPSEGEKIEEDGRVDKEDLGESRGSLNKPFVNTLISNEIKNEGMKTETNQIEMSRRRSGVIDIDELNSIDHSMIYIDNIIIFAFMNTICSQLDDDEERRMGGLIRNLYSDDTFGNNKIEFIFDATFDLLSNTWRPYETSDVQMYGLVCYVNHACMRIHVWTYMSIYIYIYI